MCTQMRLDVERRLFCNPPDTMRPSVSCDWLSTFERPTSLNSIASSADASTGELFALAQNPAHWPNSSIVLCAGAMHADFLSVRHDPVAYRARSAPKSMPNASAARLFGHRSQLRGA
jgi:hypothetical protein